MGTGWGGGVHQGRRERPFRGGKGIETGKRITWAMKEEMGDVVGMEGVRRENVLCVGRWGPPTTELRQEGEEGQRGGCWEGALLPLLCPSSPSAAYLHLCISKSGLFRL